MKLFFSVLIVFINCYSGIFIVISNKPCAQIVLPQEPSETEKYAAAELALYIKKISGCALTVVNEPAISVAETKIFIGKTEACKKIKINASPKVVSDDPYTVFAGKQEIILAGKGDRGTYYAVNHLLEIIGVRWVMPGSLGEIIPTLKNIEISECSIQETPLFIFRKWGPHDTPKELLPEVYEWQLRMRINSGIESDLAEKTGKQSKGTWGHNHKALIDTDLFADHPEYFSLVKGKRGDPRENKYWKLCMSNPAVRKIVTGNAVKILNDDPEINFLSLCPEDGGNWCECENCRSLNKNSQSGTVFGFAAEVIKNVQPLFPHVLFPVYSYSDYQFPPEGFKAPKGLCINITIRGNYAVPITHADNQKVRNQFEEWKKLDVPFTVYCYTYLMAFQQLPWVVFRNDAENLKYFIKSGAIGFYGQSGGCNWGPNGLHYYMLAKLIWNPFQDIEKLFSDYCTAAYGKAGQDIMNYYNVYWAGISKKETVISAPSENQMWAIFESAIDIYTPELMKKAGVYLEEAYRNADSPAVIARLDLIKSSYEYAKKFLIFAESNRKRRLNLEGISVEENLKTAQDVVNYISGIKEKGKWTFAYENKNYGAGKFCEMIADKLKK
ncbi:MAG: hypothetical protein A2096_08350 [Spirochaetes bacterium GWF1_41_5]|nr:MAG: hypothetical protein A2096_08350 [Spirochaetes bacterium GWF1_41_5]HBE03703.1 hypothetical protein [Spirochaetia bacterium]